MHYFGGKYRIRKQIAEYLNKRHRKGQTYYEPFVGSGWILSSISFGPCIASDLSEPLIGMWKALQSGWIPPEYVTEDEYKQAHAIAKTGRYTKQFPIELVGFIGFGCSFAGKWFGGYARSTTQNSYAKTAKNSLLKKLKSIPPSTTFLHCSYKDINPLEESLIYADPPYAGTTSYTGVGKFDHTEFWEVMRKLSAKNTVLISEYTAPEDFKTVLTIETRTDIRTAENKVESRQEKLFEYQK